MAGLVIANWKMHGSMAAVDEFVDQWNNLPPVDNVGTVVCPPYPYLLAVADAMTGMELGAQNCSESDEGAFTGEVSADMLADCGCRYALAGHSERRLLYGESDAQVAIKALRIATAGMKAVVCVGERLDERERGDHEVVVGRQLRASLTDVPATQLVVAYEPVWAIGSGRVATPEQAEGMHAIIRTRLLEQYGDVGNGVPILYGGSVKPDNAAALFKCPNIDGALVGGASLKAESFWQIASAMGAGRT